MDLLEDMRPESCHGVKLLRKPGGSSLDLLLEMFQTVMTQ